MPFKYRPKFPQLTPSAYRNRKPIHLIKKSIVVTLWNLTKKYDLALKHHELLPIKESEIDREEISDAYQFLETPWERVLDGRFYETVATMQHRRDSHFAIPDVTPIEWITQFAKEVKRRATPLVFLVSRESAIPHFVLPQTDSPLAMDETPSKEDQSALAKHHIRYCEVSISELETRQEKLVKQLQGQQFKLKELSKILTNWELDLLSQMIRDKVLPAVFLDAETIRFKKQKSRSNEEIFYAAGAIEVTRREEVQ
jgi:hypothetical protein